LPLNEDKDSREIPIFTQPVEWLTEDNQSIWDFGFVGYSPDKSGQNPQFKIQDFNLTRSFDLIIILSDIQIISEEGNRNGNC